MCLYVCRTKRVSFAVTPAALEFNDDNDVGDEAGAEAKHEEKGIELVLIQFAAMCGVFVFECAWNFEK